MVASKIYQSRHGAIYNYESLQKLTIKCFIVNFFAPMFFVSIGLGVDFIANFSFILFIAYFILAVSTKFIAVKLASRFFTLSSNDSNIAAWGMISKGAMEIIVASVALQHKFIDHAIFVVIVVTALVTSILSGIMMKRYTNVQTA